MKLIVRFIIPLLLFPAALPQAASAAPSTVADCAVALTPLHDIVTLTDRQKYAWLDLITEETYESAKTAIKASADVDLLDLIKLGNAEADYNTFNERRRKYLEQHQGTYDRDLALSIYTQHLPAGAHAAWVECVKAVSHQAGLFAWFEEEKADQARLVVHYYGISGSQISVVVTARGITNKLQNKYDLKHDASVGIILDRREESAIVIDASGGGLTTGAASAYPTGGGGNVALFVSPYIVTPLTAGPCPDAPQDKCAFCVKNFTSVVDAAAVAPGNANLLLKADAGGSVAPTSTIGFKDRRALDDIKLTGPAKLQVQFGGSTATIASVNAKELSCTHPTLRLPGSTVLMRLPEPVYDWTVTGPFTAQVVLRRDIEYHRMGGNIGCPQCGDLYAAEILLREGDHDLPIAYFDSIVLAKNEDSGHWYSCGDGKCGSNGDFTETNDKHSAVCLGKRTCWVWRHVDDGNGAKDTFTVTFHRRDLKCVRNCPAIIPPAAALPVGAPPVDAAPVKSRF